MNHNPRRPDERMNERESDGSGSRLGRFAARASDTVSGWGRSLRSKARTWAGQLPLPEDGAEPINLSAPSVPYYENLAQRFSLAALLLFLMTFIFVVTALISNRDTLTYANLYYLVKDINASSLSAQAQAGRMEYPISAVTPAFTAYRGGLVSVGGQEVSVISGAGKQTLSVNVSYAKPAVAASDKYFIAYGRGENSYSVFNAFTLIRQETTEYPVYGAAVADDGSYAVVTRSRSYTSEVLFYDKSMNPVANYHRNGYVTSVALNSAGTYAAVTSVEDKDGAWVSTVVLVRLTGRVTYETVTLENTFSGVCGFLADDRIAVVYTDRLQVLRTDGSVVSETGFSGETAELCAVSEGRAALLFKNAENSYENSVKVFDKNGKIVYTVSIDTGSEPTFAAFGGNTLYVRAGSRLFRISPDGNETACAAVSRETAAVLPGRDGSVLVCGPAAAVRLSAKAFSAS